MRITLGDWGSRRPLDGGCRRCGGQSTRGHKCSLTGRGAHHEAVEVVPGIQNDGRGPELAVVDGVLEVIVALEDVAGGDEELHAVSVGGDGV